MFSEAKAQRVTRFIECLKHTKGEFHGKPFKLLPWQETIIRDVFGTVRDDDPTMRQYNTAYIEIPNATQIAALGTIKWYKDGSSTALSTTGPTLNITSSDVTNKASYIAQLEG